MGFAILSIAFLVATVALGAHWSAGRRRGDGELRTLGDILALERLAGEHRARYEYGREAKRLRGENTGAFIAAFSLCVSISSVS
ncbi:MAG: hypothetical protein S0880_33695 [Actinomycetota bacterium]|nr:hypothetical protein [Actinomycetota bacterium]